MTGLPTGTVTFLFTDIETSTRLWERHPAAARTIVERHFAIVRHAVESHGGVLYKTIGDATQSAFATAPRGVAAALAAQRDLTEEPWPVEQRPLVRMALHAGAAHPENGDYLAGCLNRLARLLDAAHGEQILLSEIVATLAHDALPQDTTLEELGEHRLRDILQPEEIFQLRHPALRADFPSLHTPGRLPHNLPAHPTSFLGREREQEEIESLLMRPGVRLVTLTGPGGVGKTRLALRVAAESLESFRDGAFVIDLARLSDPDLVLPAAATALGLREQPGQTSAATLADYLRDRHILLLFDNFEHVLPAASQIADLLAAAPALTVLATSRTRLSLQAEYEYRVETLPVPDLDALPPLDDLARYDAIALFVSRAQALRPGFALTAQNAPAVAAICASVDGLPLAIELAAARVKLLSPEALLERLDRRLATLTGGARDLPARQRTLRDTIAWSHDLLLPGEKILFRRLSVFVAGWTLEGVEAVSAVSTAETVDPLHDLAALIDQSLVDEWPGPVAASGDPRYRMLETIRDFASEQLAASDEIADVEHAFEQFLMGRAEAADCELKGPRQLLWLEHLEAEHDNLRAALGRALDRGDGDYALRLALRLWNFWRARGYRNEGRAWLERALASAKSTDITQRDAAEFGLGTITFDLGDYDAAEGHFRKSLEARRQFGNATAEAEALSALALIAVNRLAYEEASQLGESALALLRESGDQRGQANALRVLGMIAREQRDFPSAFGLFEESMALGHALNDATWTARISTQLGITHRLAGNAAQAKSYLESSRAFHTTLGDRFALGVIANNLGHLTIDGGDVDQAVTLYAEALGHFDAVGGSEGAVEALEFLAVAIAARGDAASALRLFGAGESVRDLLHLPPRLETDELRVASGVTQATQAAGQSAVAALEAGKMLKWEQARDEALHLALSGAGSSNANA